MFYAGPISQNGHGHMAASGLNHRTQKQQIGFTGFPGIPDFDILAYKKHSMGSGERPLDLEHPEHSFKQSFTLRSSFSSHFESMFMI